MKAIALLSATAMAASLMLPLAAQAEPKNAKQFNNAMQNASQARLNKNGSTVLRFDAEQDMKMSDVASLNTAINANSIVVDDSLVSNLDVEQDATMGQSAVATSGVVLNSVDMTRARSISTSVDQDATIRRINAVDSTIAANTISIR